jgi:hypothetical protein
MSYCPKCENGDGDVQWHRRCALVVLGHLLLADTGPNAYRYHPKE